MERRLSENLDNEDEDVQYNPNKFSTKVTHHDRPRKYFEYHKFNTLTHPPIRSLTPTERKFRAASTSKSSRRPFKRYSGSRK